MTGYPPQPWSLRGQMHASVFLVPARDVLTVAQPHVPPGFRPVRVAGRCIVGTAWVDYEPGGVLHYRELMATVLVRRGLRLFPTIIAIWVDSESSRDGGRELWAIPKDLADFDFDGDRLAASDANGPIARSTVRVRVSLPWGLPVAFRVAQQRSGRPLVSPVRSRARLALSSATFVADPGGPLGFLAGRRPLLTLSLRDFRMSFGTRE